MSVAAALARKLRVCNIQDVLSYERGLEIQRRLADKVNQVRADAASPHDWVMYHWR
jgi:hypothetical protein